MAQTITLSSDITDIGFNGTDLDAVYCGSTLVWQKMADSITDTTTTATYVPFTAAVNTPYLTFAALPAEGSASVHINSTGLEYSTDRVTWHSASGQLFLSPRLYVRGKGVTNTPSFTITTGKVVVYGNIASLWNYEDLTEAGHVYSKVFYGCTALFDASGLYIPEQVSKADYMFWNCEALVYAPLTLGSTLEEGAYMYMFYACDALRTAPKLPATTLTKLCYKSMFYLCYALEKAPDLPATTLADSCYTTMFFDCRSIVDPPAMIPEAVADSCCLSMFCGCTSLTSAPALPATELAESCYSSMFANCDSLLAAPELPATGMVDSCYNRMFYGCKLIQEVRMAALTGCSESSFKNMLNSVVSTGTLYRNPAWDISDSDFRTYSEMSDTWTFADL